MADISIIIKITPPDALDSAKLPGALNQALRKVALHLEGKAKDNVTPFTITGRLRSSITHTVGLNKVTIDTKVAYAPFVEYGTRPHIIRPKSRKALAWPTGGQSAAGLGRGTQGTLRGKGSFAFAKVVHHPGTKGHHYMKDALDSSRGEIIRMITDELHKAIIGK